MTMPNAPIQPAVAVVWVRAMPVSVVQAGEEVAEVLADGDAEVTVEGLEHDVDRLASGWARASGSASVRAR